MSRLSSMIRTDGSTAPLTRPDGSPIRILAVDDESSLTELLSMAMRYEGWQVATAASGGQAVKVARETRPDAIVLDMMLPDFDGLEVMRRIRAEDPDVPVIFLTAKDSVEDRIGGLTAGGDDYVTKPFSLEEVIARLRALLRRSGAALARSDSTLVVGDLTLDEDSHEVQPRRRGDSADGHRVRAAPLPDAQPAASAQQGPDPGSGLELRLRRPGKRRRALHLLPPQEDRRQPSADDSHPARRWIRTAPSGRMSQSGQPAPAPAARRRSSAYARPHRRRTAYAGTVAADGDAWP